MHQIRLPALLAALLAAATLTACGSAAAPSDTTTDTEAITTPSLPHLTSSRTARPPSPSSVQKKPMTKTPSTK